MIAYRIPRNTILILKCLGWCLCFFQNILCSVSQSLHSSTSPEVNGTQSNQHASQHCGLLSQHNGTIIIEPPAK